MASNTFSGTSKSGNFDDAVASAIAEAKQSLQTAYVDWKLINVSGSNGGIAPKNDLTVKIEVTSPTGDDSKNP